MPACSPWSPARCLWPRPRPGCSEAELEALCEALYNDSLAAVKQAALYLLGEEEEEREEPPGGAEPRLQLAGKRRAAAAVRTTGLRCASICRAAAEALACRSRCPLISLAAAPLELSLVLCDDAHMRGLNAEWRGVDAPTDVLSFELEDDDDEDAEGGAPEVGAWRCTAAGMPPPPAQPATPPLPARFTLPPRLAAAPSSACR